MIDFGRKKISGLNLIRNKKFWKNVDYIIWIVPIILVHLSCFLIASTQRVIGITDWYQHAIMAYIGFLIIYFIAQFPLEGLRKYIFPIYLITLLILLYVNFSGTSALGAQRWLSFAGFNIQPSEVAKITLILVLASILDRRRFADLSHLTKPLLVSFLPWILVFLQPDLGTSLVFGAILLGMLYWSGMPYEWAFIILATLVTGLLACLYKIGLIIWIPIIGFLAYKSLPKKKLLTLLVILFHSCIAKITPWFWLNVLKDYQRDRLIIFVDPTQDPLGGGYHMLQSKIGIGSGGLIGSGLMQGQLTKLKFIPEQHTDFIFSALGEETGFLGSLLVIFLFFILIFRLIRISIEARTNFESLIVIGIASMFIFQIMVNIFMTIGLGPVTGIPLPFMSYGRTALLVNFISLGFCLSVSRRGQSIRKNL
ncbi:rod shape-determining protein RodA [Prochlorococcus marinus]|uniref:Peptidoglycan glycosyltransferase RodA n=1 Tax=Prochlorococcus marinus XMU1408 TaxID=2213228 RepID=A0A318QXU7_PROMR|nr:rod shape-determining protein RodA [Prochlorococcus marinus]MBW3042801.1 rod shape-determining protein RodA [Prochlorococcus marinus str. XMU1408]PYE00628.1 rod shape-determining protein RodA [Prochlorococcus marinus XMU1408]